MSELRIDTTAEFGGPWLLENSRLVALDEIIDEHCLSIRAQAETESQVAMEARYKELVALSGLERAREALSDDNQDQAQADEFSRRHEALRERAEDETRIMKRYLREKREVAIDIGDGKKLVGQRFAELAKLPEALHCKPRLFDMSLELHGISATMQVRAYSGDLEIRVLPEENAQSTSLFVALHSWANASLAPTWQRWWRKIVGIHWVLSLFIISMVGVSASVRDDTSDIAHKRAAHELLARGISTTDQTKAIEILLSISSGYGSKPSGFTRWNIVFIFTLLALSVVLSFCPKCALGIGVGARSIVRWRLWMQFVAIIVPGAILTEVLLPNAADILAAWAAAR